MKTYAQYLNEIFPGTKVQKLSINAGFSCPNRDGTIGTGGCIYCRNDSFTPGYCHNEKSVSQQIEEGKEFFSRKYPRMKFLAYFQSYTNTHNKDINFLKHLYNEALGCENIVGLIIGTRPDTLDTEIIDLLSEINREKPVFLEIGAETTNNHTLRLINRNHIWEDVEKAVISANKHSLHCGLHLIAGLPGEDKEDILRNVRKACELPIETLKIHQLQILYGTKLYELWREGKIKITPFELDDYLNLCVEILKIIPDHIVIERFVSQSPPEMIVAPQWNIKNYQFYDKLKSLIKIQ